MGALGQAWLRSWQPPSDAPIYEWAAQHLDLPNSYQPPGRFNVATSRHLIAPFEALQSSRIRVVNLLFSPGTGKTLVADIWCAWTIANAPGSFQFNWNADRMGKEHAESRIMPLLKNCELIRPLLPNDRHRDRTQEIGFAHGAWLYVRGATEANTQSKHLPYQANDEVWQWPAGRHHEASARLARYEQLGLSKQLNASQGGERVRDATGETVGDDWHRLALSGANVFTWQVQCPQCAGWILPRLEETVDGEQIYRLKWDGEGENIRFICKHCAVELRDTPTLKSKWNATGRYVRLGTENDNEPDVWRAASDAQRVTFHFPEMAAVKWGESYWRDGGENPAPVKRCLVFDYIEAIRAKRGGVLEPLKAFVQKRLADFWDEQGQVAIIEVTPTASEYAATADWPDEKFRCLTVDCQAHLADFYGVIRAHSDKGEHRRLWRGRLTSFEAIAAVQREFKIKSCDTVLDAGYRINDVARAACRFADETGPWTLMKGDGRAKWFDVTVKDRKEKRPWKYSEARVSPTLGLHNDDVKKWLSEVSEHAAKFYARGILKCTLIFFAEATIQDVLQGLLDAPSSGWIVPVTDGRDLEERDYRRQLGGDRKIANRQGELEWRKCGPNHYRDCEKMQVVRAMTRDCLTPRGGAT